MAEDQPTNARKVQELEARLAGLVRDGRPRAELLAVAFEAVWEGASLATVAKVMGVDQAALEAELLTWSTG